jgi:hypothetical protein
MSVTGHDEIGRSVVPSGRIAQPYVVVCVFSCAEALAVAESRLEAFRQP